MYTQIDKSCYVNDVTVKRCNKWYVAWSFVTVCTCLQTNVLVCRNWGMGFLLYNEEKNQN